MNMYRQLWLLAFIRIIRMFMITMPIIVLYWQSHGLTLQDIFILQVIFSVAVIVLEVPSGYFADRFGYRLSLILGAVTSTVGFFTYWAIPSYGGFVVAEIVLALSASFASGARDALLYDTLAYYKQTTVYTKWQGRIMSAGTFSEAVAAIAAGVVATALSINAVLLIQWLVMLLAIPLSLALRDYRHVRAGSTPSLLTILHGNFITNSRLLWLTLFTAAVSASTLTMVWFIQPLWQEQAVPLIYFGYLWAGLNGIAGLGALWAHHLERYCSFRTLFVGIAITPVVLYWSIAYVELTVVVVGISSLFWLLRGVSFPITQDYIQREVTSGERATVLSVNALASRLVFSIFSPFLGWVGDVWSLQTAFIVSGVVFGILASLGVAGMLWTWRYRTT